MIKSIDKKLVGSESETGRLILTSLGGESCKLIRVFAQFVTDANKNISFGDQELKAYLNRNS